MKVGKLSFRDGRFGGFYCRVDGKQHRLKARFDAAAAQVEYAHLLLRAAAGSEEGQALNANRPCRDIIAAYLDAVKGKVKPYTYERTVYFVASFGSMWGHIPSQDLRSSHGEEWWARNPAWNQSTRSLALSKLKAAFNWAVSQDILTKNPLKGLQRPRTLSRGAEAIISPEEFWSMLEAAQPWQRDILYAAYYTGARPSEYLSWTAASWHDGMSCMVMEQHKTASQTGTKRVLIHPIVRDIVVRLAALRPTGALLTNQEGQELTPRHWHHYVVTVARRAGISRQVTPYHFRHSFVDRAISSNISNAKIAAMLGHSSTKQVERHYSHIRDRLHTLGADLLSIFGGAPPAAG